MQKLRIGFFLLIISISFAAGAQFTVTGSVLDSTTREPLVSASVFCQNTTSGSFTNKEGQFSLSLKSGGYDLIISYTGYQTQTIRVNDATKLEILMIKEDKSMNEVVIKSSNEVADGWTKYGDFFIKNFIGATPNAAQCVLLNPEVLKFYFYKRSNKLKVLATDALQISNKALGYNMRYLLDSFVYYYATDINLYRGYCLYSEMEGEDSLKRAWVTARAKAYAGSKLQFMRSYYDSTLIEDGWLIEMLEEGSDRKFGKIENVYDRNYFDLIPYFRDSVVYIADTIKGDSTRVDSIVMRPVNYQVPTGQVDAEVFFPRKISITYTKKRPEPEYLKKMNLPKNVPYPISYIDLKYAIGIMENGYYYEQKDWVNQGYWSWKNLADQLPYDYLPPGY
ncbi:MAG: carboxypeptidase-like regulatory domain-containing protein [Chitinophagaceae bacterium]|nr:carboxypeptidase-like regulatory domain-containing protein [Chitinophagaceae bacterium]